MKAKTIEEHFNQPSGSFAQFVKEKETESDPLSGDLLLMDAAQKIDAFFASATDADIQQLVAEFNEHYKR